MAQYEWKKAEKNLYGTGTSPVELTVPPSGVFIIEGRGDPNGPDFAARVKALYTAAYGVRMAPKAGLELPGWTPATVYPLEGVWDLTEAPAPGPLNKASLVYRIMIRQPAFVGPETAALVLESVRRKKKVPLLDEVRFETEPGGRFVQMLHEGPFDTEPASFRRMTDWCRKESLARVGHSHREIYLSDPARTAPEAYRTLLRFPVRDHYSCD